jgi:DNA replication and repair protein RecF
MIESVRLHQVRSWSDGIVAFTPGTHIFWGENGAGKTTILEACIIAATGRSHRAGALREVIAGDGEQASITVSVRDDGGDPTDALAKSTLGVEISRAGRTKHAVNGTPRSTAALGQRLRVAAFVPEETGLVVGAPSVRRGLLDRVASQWQREYGATLSRYERALRQRNRLLKDALEVDGAARRAIAGEMRPWTELLIATGSEVVAGRLALLAALSRLLAAAHKEVAPSEGELATEYVSREAYQRDESASACAARLSAAFDQTAETEGYQGYTLVGPHRDDISFHIDGSDIAPTASRGQQRSLLLALLLAEITLLTDEHGRPPVLLLDDAFSELDPQRREHLVARIAALPQSIITATALEDLAPGLVAKATAREVKRGPHGSAVAA